MKAQQAWNTTMAGEILYVISIKGGKQKKKTKQNKTTLQIHGRQKCKLQLTWWISVGAGLDFSFCFKLTDCCNIPWEFREFNIYYAMYICIVLQCFSTSVILRSGQICHTTIPQDGTICRTWSDVTSKSVSVWSQSVDHRLRNIIVLPSTFETNKQTKNKKKRRWFT